MRPRTTPHPFPLTERHKRFEAGIRTPEEFNQKEINVDSRRQVNYLGVLCRVYAVSGRTRHLILKEGQAASVDVGLEEHQFLSDPDIWNSIVRRYKLKARKDDLDHE